MQSLRSITITVTSSLLQTAPPLCLASVLSFSQGLYLNFSLNIEATGSHVPHKSLNQSHATFMPDATQAVSRFPLGLSWRTDSHQFWRHPFIFDTSSVVRLRSSLWFTTDILQGMPFPQRSPQWLFTNAAWGVLEPAPANRLRGTKPSSPVQLRTLYIKVRSWRTNCYRSKLGIISKTLCFRISGRQISFLRVAFLHFCGFYDICNKRK